MPADTATHHDYSAASCNFARAQRDRALLKLQEWQNDFHIIRGGLEAVDRRDVIPLLEDGVWDAVQAVMDVIGETE
jgi:hypothetical protein